MKKVLNLMIAVILLFFLCTNLIGCKKNDSKSKITIVTTDFPCFDFVRAVTREIDDVEVTMLLKPGAEMHDFEPTPQDIKNIRNSEIFIYVGGDSDEWIKTILTSINTDKTKVIRLMDLVNVVEEEIVEGMEEEDESEEEYDEHVWTSPINVIAIVNKLKDEIIKIDKANKELYEANADNYINELTNIDAEIRDIVKNSKRKEIIFGDRFPLRYFVEEYGLSYYAAFPGCSHQTEASAKTISFLIDKVKSDKIPVVFQIELSNGKIADTISKETGAKVLEFNAAHNISSKDFYAGVTYIDIMKKNIEVLKEALN